MTSFAELTTMGVGGYIERFVEPTTRVALIEEVEDADSKGIPLCIIGGGSNMLVSDSAFEGVVIRDARREIKVPDEAAPVEGDDLSVHVTAEAGCNWDDLVEFCVERGLAGLEGLSGIPGTVGASVVQNIGAYSQEVATTVESVEVWDRVEKKTLDLTHDDLDFGYRTSALKQSMSKDVQEGAPRLYPTGRYVVLSVTFNLTHCTNVEIANSQLANALHMEKGSSIPLSQLREAVLQVRASKAMLEDATRYRIPEMQATKRPEQVEKAIKAQQEYVSTHYPPEFLVAQSIDAASGENEDYNRHSCGSFFINPFLTEEQAAKLPEEAPRYESVMADGSKRIKTSAAWLIDNAGFHKGFSLPDHPKATLSNLHTLALTNQGGATADDILALANAIRDGVKDKYGVELVPEPVFVGLELDK